MLEIDIPGYRELNIEYLVSDYNGTIAYNGQLINDVDKLILKLSDVLEIHIVTADTFGGVKESLHGLPVNLSILSSHNPQDKQKAQYVKKLGADKTVALGNGRNDFLMLKEAALGVCIVEVEGMYSRNILVSDIVCKSAIDALNLLTNPKRLIATLRV